jgi:phage antirepressor YoqD-like protein
MSELADKRMTAREVAEALGCNPETVRGHVRALFPELMENGKTTYLNEAQVTVVLERMKETAKHYDSSGRNATYNNSLQVAETPQSRALRIDLLHRQIEAEMQAEIDEQRARAERAESKLAIAEPKAEAYDGLVERGKALCLRDAAYEIGMRQTDFIAYLLEHGYLYRKGKEFRAYARHVRYFTEKEIARNGHDGLQVLVTPEGRGHFVRLLAGKGLVPREGVA